ncbi:MAG: TIGR01777 family protein [Ignavibacteria bacterium]|nr:TIGR01777 family protein [Ignavibacteria bacterium]
MKIVIAGGSGFIGRALVGHLVETHHQVVILTRDPRKVSTRETEIEQWDGKTLGPWANCIDGAEAVINLAGELIAGKRWTEKQKARILHSRVEATRVIVAAIIAAKKKPEVLINSSGVGYYGNVEFGDVTESYPRGNDFLADVCYRWEHEAVAAEQCGVRVALLRCGVVLEKDGGALRKFLFPFKMFVGGPLGSGKQWFPWVHRDDVLGIIAYALQSTSLAGPVNVAAPHAVTMREFCRILGSVMHRPSWAPVPGFFLRGALGEMAEMLLTGQRVVPKKLEEGGFKFQFPTLDAALTDILARSSS